MTNAFVYVFQNHSEHMKINHISHPLPGEVILFHLTTADEALLVVES